MIVFIFRRGAHPRAQRQHRLADLRRGAVAGKEARRQIPSQLAKLHLALHADSGDPIVHVMKDQDAGDGSQAETLLDQIDMPIGQFTADGAYDGHPTYDAVIRQSAGASAIIPPRSSATERPDDDPTNQRDRHVAASNADGWMKWQAATGSDR
jgi:hypothetical protein